MDPQVSQRIKKLQEMAPDAQPGNERQHLDLLRSARALVSQLEKPHEKVMRMIYHEPALFMATKVLADLGIFKILAVATAPVTASQLAQNTNADAHLLERLLKHVTTENYIDEVGPDTYRANDVTRCCATPGAKGAIDDIYQVLPVVAAMPEYLREAKYANPINKDKTCWQFAHKTDQHFFEYVNTPGREAKLEALRNHMDFKTVGQRWFEEPSLMEAAFRDAISEKDNVLLIDVGGNGGHDLIAFQEAKSTSSYHNKLIGQEKKSFQQGIEPMGHDFFTAQPVKGAKAYYLKMCLHDWPDAQCKEILACLRPAMTAGYSRIILDEIIIPDQDAGWFETSVDLLMMEVHSAQERREKEWTALVDGVPGRRIKRIWDREGAVNEVIEIEAV
ncbi:S-adenosyl-L-methionine-dependent methyltransferase [Setomelanomma holmii]|uniref:S-adenosyl-L-methionine-dependent methyltransferase n=1 Tax=Setomelanomma holmii TaxID=210430 RepID=A0A9P4HMJ2_9PLEO|nr:S-adenosyl-L-methionine-dependent methyltransferase [Setomelanomma holmii]